MKAKLLLLAFLCTALLGLGQNLQVIDTATQQAAAWHYSFQVPPTGAAYLSFEVKNTGSTLIKTRIYKNVLQTSGSHQTYFSYGAYMYAPATVYSLQEPLGAGQSLPDINGRVGLETGFDANGSIGTTVVRYTVYDSLNHADSVNVTITYNVSSAAVKNVSGAALFFDAWPNPAQNKIHFYYRAPAAQVVYLSIRNALGTEIKKIPLTDLEGKMDIDVSELSPGIYPATLIADGKAILTRRLVIAH